MMSAYSHMNKETLHVNREFSNRLLNSIYCSWLLDPDSRLEVDHLEQLIVLAHKSSLLSATQVRDGIVDAAVDAVLKDEHTDIKATLDRIDSLPDAVGGQHWDVVTATARTAEETELEMLKIAVINPDLYNNLREIFVAHKHPDKLDHLGKMLREFFLSKGDNNGESQKEAAERNTGTADSVAGSATKSPT